SRAPSAASDVGANPPGPAATCSRLGSTFSPIPRTTAFSSANAASDSTPAHLRRCGPARTSLGHFNPPDTPTVSRTSTTASPATTASEPRRANGTLPGRNSTLQYNPNPAGDCQPRPRLPRPAVCSSASSTVRSGAPAATAARRSAFVEPVLATTSSAAYGPAGATNSPRSCAASTECLRVFTQPA